MNNTEVYYFTGTGNSLFIAKELQKRLPDAKLIPILSLLNKEAIQTNADTIGFVFPIYMTVLPLPVKKFLEKIDLTQVNYTFAIATRIGTTHSAFLTIEKMLNKKGKKLNSYFSINMPGNDPKFNYKDPSKEKISELEAAALKKLDSVQETIISRSDNRGKDTDCTARIPCVGLIAVLMNAVGGFKYNFYSDANCTGCGICERVCTSGKIKMTNNKPEWQDGIKCTNCSACLNYCPVHSIQIKSYTENSERYSHPYATAVDIAGQK